MPRFFIEKGNSEKIRVVGDDACHITKSLRMRSGENVTVCDYDGIEYDCVIESVGETVTLLVNSFGKSQVEPPFRATVFQALVKGDKFDTVVQKAVECGASEIIPFSSEYCVMKLSAADCEKKQKRWQKIALEAAKQSGRAVIPKVGELLSFDKMLERAKSFDLPLFLYESEKKQKIGDALKTAAKRDSIAVIVGSEGGFSEKEASAAANVGLLSVGLGPRILRTETASSFALACISYEYELSDK